MRKKFRTRYQAAFKPKVALAAFSYIFLVPDSRIVMNPVGDSLGELSYSLYLLHVPILILMKPTLRSGVHGKPLLLLVFLLLAVGVSTLTYQLLEAPSRKLIRERLLENG